MSFHFLRPISNRHADNNNFAKIQIPVPTKSVNSDFNGGLGYDYHLPKVTS